MTKPKFETPDMTQKNIEKIAQLFPNCITESKDENGNLKKTVNFELLQQMLKCDIADKDEAYEFTWVGKNAAIVEANKPIRKTLRPCPAESVNWDTTENLYIEGDNLEVLKLLQESYLSKVKMIYIDPPYNTGNDFIYRDDFAQSQEEYSEESGQVDENGDRLFRNTDSNGRFHSDWCSMIYSRLMLARNLLSDDGVIFISISEEEVHTLKQICNEVFGETNFRNTVFTRRYDKNLNRQFMEQGLSTLNTGLEYILMYSRIQTTTYNPVFRVSTEERASKGYWKGFWNDADRPTMRYDILGVVPTAGQWKWKKALADEAVKNYADYVEKFSQAMTLEEYWEQTGKCLKFIRRNPDGKGKNLGVEHWVAPADGILRNTNWSDLLASKPTGVEIPFDSPKNIEVLLTLLKLSNVGCDGIVLDFFSGSATTAHAVMQLNAEDGGHRKFIMVQLPEPCDEKSEAYKAGYPNICEIGKERIRRAGKKISEQWLVDSKQWSVDSGQKKGGKNGCSKLQGIADMAEGNADCEGDLFAGEETSQGRDLYSIRPDAESGSVDSVKHSGRAVKEFNEGVCLFSSNSKRLEGGTRNTASSLQGNRLSDGRGNSTSDELVARGKQNALYDESKTDNSQLTTDNCPLDIGFRVLKVDESNMKDVYYAASEYDQGKLEGLESNIKEDRNDLDLLFGCLLDWGLPLSLPYTSESIGKFTVHTYNNGDLIACFTEDVSEDIVKEIARKKPLRAVFRDSSFSNSASKINVFEIFKMISPETSVKVI